MAITYPPSHKRTIVEMLMKAGIPATKFDFYEEKVTSISNVEEGIPYHHISCKDTDYFFRYRHTWKDTEVEFRPGRPRFKMSITWNEKELNMNALLQHVKVWIQELKKELDAEDFLRKVLNQKGFMFDTAFFTDEEFSEEEIPQAKQILELVRGEFQKLNLLPEHMEVIERKIDNLDKKVTKLSKFDWRSLVIGTIVSIGVNLGIDTNTTDALFNSIGSGYNNIMLTLNAGKQIA